MPVIGQPITPPAASTACADQELSRPVVTVLEGIPVPQRIMSVRVTQLQPADIEWTMRDQEGRPIDLSSCLCDVSGGSSSGSSSSSVEQEPQSCIPAKLRIREALASTSTRSLEADATVTNASGGIVRFQLPDLSVKLPGILRAELGVFRDTRLVFSNQFTVVVDRGQFGDSWEERGCPTIAEIRNRLRDSAPEDNYLLHMTEWDLGEVAEAIVRAVDLWNNSLPILPIATFTTSTFPKPSALMDGVVAYLYQAAAHNYRRNHLAYAAAGVSIDDKAKAPEYEQIAQARLMAYEKWVRDRKRFINAQQAYGTLVSPYWFRNI